MALCRPQRTAPNYARSILILGRPALDTIRGYARLYVSILALSARRFISHIKSPKEKRNRSRRASLIAPSAALQINALPTMRKAAEPFKSASTRGQRVNCTALHRDAAKSAIGTDLGSRRPKVAREKEEGKEKKKRVRAIR